MPGTPPIVDSLTVAYPAGQTFARPGQSGTVTLVGHDADAQTLALTGTITDAEGNVSAPSSVDFVISDPITHALTAPAGAPVTITPVAGQPGKFTVTAV